jgi:integrase
MGDQHHVLMLSTARSARVPHDRLRAPHNLVGAKVRVVETLSEVGSTLHTVATKNYQQRSVPLPQILSAVFARHVEAMPKKAYVFQAPNGGPLRWGNFYNRHFLPAVAQSGMPAGLHFHDLRHTYAGFLIAGGAHPRALMERLGHSTINVTLGTYGHLLPSLERDLTNRLDATLAATISRT